jgi:hypothetical protein
MQARAAGYALTNLTTNTFRLSRLYDLGTDSVENTASNCCDHMTAVSRCLPMDVFSEPFPSNRRLSCSTILALSEYVTLFLS